MKFNTQTLLSLCCLLLPYLAFATPPVPNTIMVNGNKYPLYGNPLAALIKDSQTVATAISKHSGGRERTYCSAPNEGYTTKWEIRDEQLFLTGLSGNPCSPNPPIIPISELFPGHEGSRKADWFSGQLVVPHGAMINSPSIGLPRFEKDLIYTIAAGTITAQKERYNTSVDNTPAQIQQGILFVTLQDSPANAVAQIPKRPAWAPWTVTSANPETPEVQAWVKGLERIINETVQVFQDKRLSKQELRVSGPPEFPPSIAESKDKRRHLQHVSLSARPDTLIKELAILSTDQEWIIHLKDPAQAATRDWAQKLEKLLQARASGLRENNPPKVSVQLKKNNDVPAGDAIIITP